MRFILQLWSDETRPASPAFVSALSRYTDQLEQAGVLLAAEGLVASRAGVRITMQDGQRSLHAGPFLDAPRLGDGFWILRVKSKDEALAWAKRCPLCDGDTLELRALFGLADHALVSSELALA